MSVIARDLVGRLFPERELLLRANGRVRFLRVSCAAQCTAVLLISLMVSGLFYGLTRNLLFEDERLAAQSAELARTRSAYQSLLAEATDDRARHARIARQLERKDRSLLGAMSENAALRGELGAVSGQVQSLAAEREDLAARIEALDASLEAMRAEKASLAADLGERQAELREAVIERAETLTERNRLQARSEELQHRLSALQVNQEEVLARLAARTRGSIDELRDVIAMTGLDADRLLAEAGAGGGLGGPFVELGAGREDSPGELQIAALNSHIDQWGDLQQVLRRLPLSAPMDNYVARSPYGKRRDPLNGKWAMHSGLDLGGPPKAPILSTAPGIVVFAGTHPSYGRMVEIDHGMGVRTRYGHLNSFSVRKGQRVAYRQAIGVIGNSGRSTGVHLHYEVLVNDTPRDPMRFIQAGKHVFKG